MLDPTFDTVKVNGANLTMEVDTEVSLSLISEVTYRNLWHSNRPQLQPTVNVLSTYTGESLELLVSLSVLVEYGERKSQLELLVIVVFFLSSISAKTPLALEVGIIYNLHWWCQPTITLTKVHT